MVYDFQNHQNAPELTLHAAHTYTWSLAPRLAKYLCWADVFTESEQEKVLSWITSLDPDQYLDALRASLLVFSVSDGRVAPREFQLTAGLTAFWQKHAIVNAGTGSGKTLSMVIPLLMDPDAVAIIVSPLKRLQITQAEELERFLIKPLVINQDTDLSPLQIQVPHIAFQLYFLPRVSQCHSTSRSAHITQLSSRQNSSSLILPLVQHPDFSVF